MAVAAALTTTRDSHGALDFIAFCLDRRFNTSRKNRLITNAVIPMQAMAMCALQGGSQGSVIVPDLVRASCITMALYIPQAAPSPAITIAAGVGSVCHSGSGDLYFFFFLGTFDQLGWGLR